MELKLISRQIEELKKNLERTIRGIKSIEAIKEDVGELLPDKQDLLLQLSRAKEYIEKQIEEWYERIKGVEDDEIIEVIDNKNASQDDVFGKPPFKVGCRDHQYVCDLTGQIFETQEAYQEYINGLEPDFFDKIPVGMIEDPKKVYVDDKDSTVGESIDPVEDVREKMMERGSGEATKEEIDELLNAMKGYAHEPKKAWMYSCLGCDARSKMKPHFKQDVWIFKKLKELDRHLWFEHNIVVQRWWVYNDPEKERPLKMLEYDHEDSFGNEGLSGKLGMNVALLSLGLKFARMEALGVLAGLFGFVQDWDDANDAYDFEMDTVEQECLTTKHEC